MKIEKRKRHIWAKWWYVKSEKNWQSLCIECGLIRETKIKPPMRRRNF